MNNHGNQPNLVKLFTRHGPMYIDTRQLARGRKILTIYTARGNRLADVGKTRKIRESSSWGVHYDNLFATQELSDAASDRIWKELFGENALTTKELRESDGALPGTRTAEAPASGAPMH